MSKIDPKHALKGPAPDVWVFDENHRVYNKDIRGRSTGAPIYKEHWQKVEIVGETKVSWIDRWGKRYPKSGSQGVVFSERGIEDACYVHDYSYKISEKLRRCHDAGILRKVAELIGWKPE